MRRLSDIDLRLLRIFATIVDCNGFQNAQIALNMAQSTLSTHLGTLEKRLGTRLCERGRGGFRLTRTGRETYEAAQEMFRAIDGFGARMSRLHGRHAEKLRVAAIDMVESFEDLDLAGIVADFAAEFPDVFLDLDILPPEQLQRALREGTRDAVIGPAFPGGAGLELRELASEHHLLYCGAGHPWFARPDAEIALADFHAARFSVRAYQYFDDTYKLGGIRASASVGAMEAQEILILSGRYLGFLPTHRGAPRVAAGQMRAVRPLEWSLRSRFVLAFDPATGNRSLKRAFAETALRRRAASAPRPEQSRRIPEAPARGPGRVRAG